MSDKNLFRSNETHKIYYFIDLKQVIQLIIIFILIIVLFIRLNIIDNDSFL